MSSTSISVRNTANGSLVPDSTSSVAPTRGRRRKPCACTKRNTAAASVDATTAPTSSASVQFRSSAYLATGAVISAVSNTPIEQDQRQRHRADQIGGADVVEPQLPRAGVAGQHADEQEHQQQWRAEAQREQARQNAGHHQSRAEKNGYAD